MAQQIPPVQQLEFHGVYTAGNPAQRPRGTAAKCQDFRVMPGYWLRLRGGRRARYNAGAEIRQVHPFREVDWCGSQNQLGQLKFADNSVEWHWLNLASYICAPPEMPEATRIEAIATAYDGGHALTNPVAITNISDRPVLYNGLGVRDSSTSKPPFTHAARVSPGAARYFGLDAYCPAGNPTADFEEGDGHNEVLDSVEIWVGIYHEPTEHYSNAVYAGTILATSGRGTITVSGLPKLKPAHHDATERGELYYVFYATIDGGQVPYLILNANFTGPHKVPVTASSASLSVTAGTDNGWVTDKTKEAPQDNHPPRPMRSLCYVNGRLYGVLLPGGAGFPVVQRRIGGAFGPDFTYTPATRETAGVVWSKAAGDWTAAELLGDPLQCWPFDNLAYTPSADQPVVVAPAQDNVRVLVVTPTSTFLLEEAADGLHEWITVSRIHGIIQPTTLRTTPYGTVWVTQRNQIVLLPPGSTQLVLLSQHYQSLLTGQTVRCADYLLDPLNEIDRYQVWLENGTSVIHDFLLGGEAYSATGQDFITATTVYDARGVPHHIVAKTAFYTQEAQPEDGLIPTTDETFTTGQTWVASQINGEYVRNWDDLGDSNVRKELPQADLVGDGANSAALGASPLAVEWYADFEEVKTANKKVAELAKAPQSLTDGAYRAKLTAGNRFWFKLVLKLRGHSTDDASFANHARPEVQGDLAKNFYGSLLRFLLHVGRTENRA